MRERLDSLDVRILEALGVYGPRNISYLARRIGEPMSTIRDRIEHLKTHFSLLLQAKVYHTFIGLKKASELLLTGKVIDAKEAERCGLVNMVVPLDSFESELESFIKPLTDLSLIGLKYSKKGINLGLETTFLDGLEKIEKIYLEELMTSEDAHEGLKAFLEKRKPVWKNK